MQKNNNLSPLPWYDSISEQNHRKPYAYGSVYPLYCAMGSVPPFQIQMQHSTATIATVKLVTFDDDIEVDVTQAMIQAGLQVVRYATDGYDNVVYSPVVSFGITTQEGRYYMVMTMSDGTVYYSEVFTVVADMSGYVFVQWWDEQDFIMDDSRITYSTRYRNSLWLQTQIGKPDYEFQEEGEQRDGYFFPEKMVSEKTFKFVILAPEYLCDVMRFIRMSDYVFVRDQWGRMYRCDTFLVTPEWQEQGDLASVTVEFTCDTVAKKIGTGYVRTLDGADFNNDFNNDFYN